MSDVKWDDLPKEKDAKRNYYGSGTYEARKFINAHNLNFNRGNCIKYIVRAGKKGDQIEDLEKARDYINFEIERIKKYEQ